MLVFLLLVSLSALLGGKHITSGQNESVYISLNGTIVANSSNILIRDIGEDSNALLCFTDLTSCCDSSRKGEWVFPNGTNVSIAKFGSNFYRNRGQGVVRLNRRNGSLSPTGLYCCKVPDVTSSEKTVCVNIIVGTTFLAPENFIAVRSNSREIQFSWTSPPDIEADATTTNLTYILTCRSNAVGVTSVTMTYSEAGRHTLGGLRPATRYSCSVFAANSSHSGVSTSIMNVMTMDDSSLIQLQLTGPGVNNCSQWVAEDGYQKLEFITETLVENVQNLCQCGFLNHDRITGGAFHCLPAASPREVTYRAMIHGTTSTNSSQLVSRIKQWTEGGTNLVVQHMLLRVNGSCTVAATTREEEKCPLSDPNTSSPTANENNENCFAFVGVALGIGIIAGASITSFIALITCCILRQRAQKKKNAHSSTGKRIEATSPMFESGAGEISLSLRVGDAKIAHKSMDPMDHEYADLTEISSKQRAQAQGSHPAVSGGKSKTGNYELTQCLAYGAVPRK